MSDQPDYAALVSAAIAASKRAYAPYSHFAVGAAVLTASGNVYPGCNVENAVYPAGACAERVALWSAYAAGEREIVALAVVTPTEQPASPCGTCRQVIAELAPNAVIILANMHGNQRQMSPDQLLPYGFGKVQLEEAANNRYAGSD